MARKKPKKMRRPNKRKRSRRKTKQNVNASNIVTKRNADALLHADSSKKIRSNQQLLTSLFHLKILTSTSKRESLLVSLENVVLVRAHFSVP
jgi:hypothetical protein